MEMHETVLGPPGTGKTQSISGKVRKCLEDGIPPDRIACVSFTRRAATESRTRVQMDMGVDERDLTHFRTLHSMAYWAGGYSTGDVMGPADLNKIGEEVGIPFGTKYASDLETDFDTLGVSKGDHYMHLYHLARSKMLTLEEMYNESGDYSVHWSELSRLVAAYDDYKLNRHKIDFTDMIAEFILSDSPPPIEALYVDEAQDLSTLQWKMIDVLRQSPDIQVFVGDDDQAIMNFQGADVGAFLRATEKKTVLEKSYRVPRDPWKEAQRIVCQIEDRAPKTWHPKDEDGSVHFHQSIWDVPLEEGEWCIMARTNRIASRYAKALRDEGWVYSRFGHPSIPAKTYEAITDWESWTRGAALSAEKIQNIYTFMKADEGYTRGHGPRSKGLRSLDEDFTATLSQARDNLGLLTEGDTRWHRALDKIDLDTKNYVLNALKRKDNVKNPRIKISTIHSMKGGECDNIVVIPDLSYAAHKAYRRDPSIEHRVYYVAVTRTKQSLHIMMPETREFYEL
jgi:superfamily I DNA/RNA helicase